MVRIPDFRDAATVRTTGRQRGGRSENPKELYFLSDIGEMNGRPELRNSR